MKPGDEYEGILEGERRMMLYLDFVLVLQAIEQTTTKDRIRDGGVQTNPRKLGDTKGEISQERRIGL